MYSSFTYVLYFSEHMHSSPKVCLQGGWSAPAVLLWFSLLPGCSSASSLLTQKYIHVYIRMYVSICVYTLRYLHQFVYILICKDIRERDCFRSIQIRRVSSLLYIVCICIGNDDDIAVYIL